MSEDFDLLAAEFRRAAADAGVLIEVLAKKFQDALPHVVRVRRAHGLLGGRVVEVTLDLGEVRWRFEAPNPAAVRVSRQRLSGGVAIGRVETFGGETWVEALCRDLGSFTEGGTGTRDSIARLLGLPGGGDDGHGSS